MTNVVDLNRPAFDRAESRLLSIGHDVCNPHDLAPKGATWREAMKHDIAALVFCDAVATLDGHEDSRGARMEVYIARELGIAVGSLESMMQGKETEA